MRGMGAIDVIGEPREGEREELDLLGGVGVGVFGRTDLRLDVLVQPEGKSVLLEAAELVRLRAAERLQVLLVHVGSRGVAVADRRLQGVPQPGEGPETWQQTIDHGRSRQGELRSLALVNELTVAEVREHPEGPRRDVREADAGGDVEEAPRERRQLEVGIPVNLGLVEVRNNTVA